MAATVGQWLQSLKKLEQFDFDDFFRKKRLGKKEWLWKEGDPARDLVFILSGAIRLSRESEFKGRAIVTGIVTAGNLLGAANILDGGSRAVSAIALEESTFLMLDREHFARLLRDYPQAGMELLTLLVQAVAAQYDQIVTRLASIF